MKKTETQYALAQKLMFVTLSICVSGIFLISTVIYFSIANLNENILMNEINTRSDVITRGYVEPLWLFDLDQIKEISNSFLNNKGFASMIALKVVDPKGKILFYKSNLSEKNKLFEDYARRPFTKTAVSAIKRNDEVLGTVYMAFTTEGIMTKYKKMLVTILAFSFFILALIAVWIHVFFQRLITNPLNKILEHIKQIKNQNYEIKNSISSSYEMIQISNALNYASLLIKKRNSDLKNYTENLEKLVAERTSELETQMIKNMSVNRLVAVGEVASGIAHEINNPLMVISGLTQKLKREIKNTEHELILQGSLDKITLMCNRIVKIINGLKLISRDGHGDQMEEFSINKMLDEIRLLTEMKILSMDIQFSIQIDSSINLAYGREVQISQVLINLINNSVDAIMSQNEKWITIVVTDQSDLIEFRITDSGNGIPQELKDKILLPFFTTKEVGKGTGLGLSISNGIIQEHGGTFFYNDQVPNTQFVFSIHKVTTQHPQ